AVFVDFAHTPDALRQVLSTLREISASSAGRILCVFGCGGDRDPGKRGAMGAAAAELADEVFVTNDNPRGENPAAIADAICAGMERPSEVHVELDRRLAIRAALRAARSEDVVLIAGKGHESTQTIGETQHVFDDVQVVQEEAL
ncbi:MAG: UDP-N-acetylmuramyl tripeptide synthase, partial [Candidatus Paceibacteria bacterium]